MIEETFEYEAPLYAKANEFIKQLALRCDVECKIEVTKGWMTESGTVVCTGTYEKMIEFRYKFKLAMRDYDYGN